MRDAFGIAELALHAATEADRFVRGVTADLTALARLADELDRAWANADTGEVLEFWDTLPEGDPVPETLQFLGDALAARTAMLRRAATGEGAALALPACLGLHRSLLALGMAGLSLRGMAA